MSPQMETPGSGVGPPDPVLTLICLFDPPLAFMLGRRVAGCARVPIKPLPGIISLIPQNDLRFHHRVPELGLPFESG